MDDPTWNDLNSDNVNEPRHQKSWGITFVLCKDAYRRLKLRQQAYSRMRALHKAYDTLHPNSPGSSPKFHLRWKMKWIVYVLLAFCMLSGMIFSLAFALTYHSLNLANIAPSPQIAYLYYDDGSEMSRIVPEAGNREDVDFAAIPKSVIDSVIAAEDHTFYTDPGFSFTGLTRAVIGRIINLGAPAGGGSTISQQYIKNAVTGNAESLLRKWKELVFSIKLTHEWSKDKILTAYLNTIYFGRDAYGIGMAARAYFNKSVERITLPEAALLAGLIQAPSLLDPSINPIGARNRWDYVMDSLVEIKAITPLERNLYTFPHVIPPHQNNQVQGSIGLIRNQVIAELRSLKISEEQLNTQGYRITTTISRKVQHADTQAVADNLRGQPRTMRAAVVSIDPRDGAVKGYFGGINPNGFDYAQAGLQTGSSFKVFALIAALEQGIPLSKKYPSTPYHIAGITIRNSDGETCGTCNIATALKMSLNTVYYRLMSDLNGGPAAVAQAAHDAGIAESFGDVKHTLISSNGVVEGGIVLGQYLSRVIDMASAYATIANSGVYYQPHFIQKIVDAQGNVIFDRSNYNPSTRTIPYDVANNTIAAMEPIARYSRNHALVGGRISGAKTGTTQLGATMNNKDAWMIGFTPQLSTAVWLGTDHGIPLRTASGGIVYGSGIPSSIWKEAMDKSLAGEEILHFPKPTAIGGQAGIPGPSTITTVVKDSIVIGNLTIPLGTKTTTVVVDGDGHVIKPKKPPAVVSSSSPQSPHRSLHR